MSIINPTKQITLTWKGLTAYAKDKVILNNCEGYCQPGEMLAIMGPSGAGKTTLLSLISKRINPSLTIQGDVTLQTHRSSPTISHSIRRHSTPLELLSTRMTFSSKHSLSEVVPFGVRNIRVRCLSKDTK